VTVEVIHVWEHGEHVRDDIRITGLVATLFGDRNITLRPTDIFVMSADQAFRLIDAIQEAE
jgi:hypothetical protein